MILILLIFIFIIIFTIIIFNLIKKYNTANELKNDKEKADKKKGKKEKNCLINTMTVSKCYNNNINLCPISSYKQCTNNYPPLVYPPLTKCVCNSFSLELCNKPTSNSCNIEKCNLSDIEQKYFVYPKTNPRVNIYNSE